MWLNFKRKSVRGFSTTGIVIKLVGASFLFMNAYMTGELISVVLYGLFNVLQHSIFMIQFSMYPSNNSSPNNGQGVNLVENALKDDNKHTFKLEAVERKKYLIWLAFPLLPFMIATIAPKTIAATNMIKPITQVFSHLPQLQLCYQLKTTQGISMLSQHLNFIGGIAGLTMCFIIEPLFFTTYLLYLFSILQAVSLYAMALYYDFSMPMRQHVLVS